jgi:hypothetical protein
MNNSKRMVELLTKSADLITALRQRKTETLWQRLHKGTHKRIDRLSMSAGWLTKRVVNCCDSKKSLERFGKKQKSAFFALGE